MLKKPRKYKTICTSFFFKFTIGSSLSPQHIESPQKGFSEASTTKNKSKVN